MKISLSKKNFECLSEVLSEVDKRSSDPIYNVITERIRMRKIESKKDVSFSLEESEVLTLTDAFNDYPDYLTNSKATEQEKTKKLAAFENLKKIMTEETRTTF